ncbi:MAG TPA: sigma factor, partial [Acidimicrobiales bacterium]|nr:sigma factor [Acidimicrobiales bacterium]
MANTRRLSDASLVRRSQQGDRRAFGALVGRYDWRLRGLAHALLLDPADMDAALSAAYLRAWRDIVRLPVKEDVAAWLYRAAYNACIDRLRTEGRQADEAPGKGIRAGLAALAPADRVAVVLVDREGFPAEAAARILGLTEAVIEDRLQVARATLARHTPEPPKPKAKPKPAPAPTAAAATQLPAEAPPAPDLPAAEPAATTEPPAEAP